MSRARDLADSADKDIVGTLTVDALTSEGQATIDGLTVGQGAGNVATNTAVGKNALAANTSGAYCTAVGYYALNANTSGINTAVGYLSLYNSTGGWNTAVGSLALAANTTGNYNTAIGSSHSPVNNGTLQANTTGSYNIALGSGALYSNTTASYNTAVGYRAGYSATTSGLNTFIGMQAGYSSNSTNGRNTFVGMSAGYYVTTGEKNTIIGRYNGNQGGLDIRTASNQIVLSDGDGNPRMYCTSAGSWYLPYNTSGSIGASFAMNPNGVVFTLVNAVTGGYQMVTFNNGNGSVGNITTSGSSTSYNTTSDYRLKENVVAMTGATERLKQLNPVRFNFITDADKTVDGFIAHEVSAIVPEAITGEKDAVDDEGNPVYQGIDQSKLVPLLVATIQELEARIAALESN